MNIQGQIALAEHRCEYELVEYLLAVQESQDKGQDSNHWPKQGKSHVDKRNGEYDVH